MIKKIPPFIYLLLVFSLSNIDCNTTKNQSKNNSSNDREIVSDNTTTEKSTEEKPVEESIHTDTKNKRDSLFASIKRTPCYGRCPTYSIKIYRSGYVIYDGIRFVDSTMLGKHSTRINKKQIQQIINKAMEVRYFDFEDVYDSPVTDFPSTYIYLSVDGKNKLIKDRVGGPPELKEFEKFIDRLFEDVKWSRVESR